MKTLVHDGVLYRPVIQAEGKECEGCMFEVAPGNYQCLAPKGSDGHVSPVFHCVKQIGGEWKDIIFVKALYEE